MNTEYLRERFGLTQSDLSIIFGIPKRTITNWDNRSCMPHYVWNMMLDLLLRYAETPGIHVMLEIKKNTMKEKKDV